MAKFEAPPKVTKIAEARGFFGRARWRLLEPLVFHSEILGPLTVPGGFETDYASVPRLPLTFAIAGDTGHEAGIVHDWLYSLIAVRRALADAVFYEALRALGVPGWRCWLMWLAVRLGGWSAKRRR